MVLKQQAAGSWEAAAPNGWEERLHEILVTLVSAGAKDQFLYCLERLVDRHPALLASPQGATYTEHVLALLPRYSPAPPPSPPLPPRSVQHITGLNSCTSSLVKQSGV